RFAPALTQVQLHPAVRTSVVQLCREGRGLIIPEDCCPSFLFLACRPPSFRFPPCRLRSSRHPLSPYRTIGRPAPQEAPGGPGSTRASPRNCSLDPQTPFPTDCLSLREAAVRVSNYSAALSCAPCPGC